MTPARFKHPRSLAAYEYLGWYLRTFYAADQRHAEAAARQ